MASLVNVTSRIVGVARRSLGSAGRRFRVVALVGVLTAALVALAPMSAPAEPVGERVFTHSAKGGELRGGRLILRGVAGRVTWITNRGGSGTVSVRRLHAMAFGHGQPATGTLHVAGNRGGDELTFRLSKPRYNPARHTVSYRAKPLDDKRLPGGGARAGEILRGRKFGATSLTIVPAPQAGLSCTTAVVNQTGHTLMLVSASTGSTNEWFGPPPASIPAEDDGGWSTANPNPSSIGCTNTVVYRSDSSNPAQPPVQFTFEQSAGTNTGSNTCTSSDPAYECVAVTNEPGAAEWRLAPS
jgi:hypothetical protein